MKADKVAYDKANPERVKAWDRRKMLKDRYGEDAEVRYQMLWDRQGGRCAICDKEERLVDGQGRATRLAMDHCHETGRVRGLLCRSCNMLLGQIGDTEAGIRRYLDYVVEPVGYALPEVIEMPPRWANEYGSCTVCATTAVPHGGGGLCRNCYMRKMRAEGKPWAQDTRTWSERRANGALTPKERRELA